MTRRGSKLAVLGTAFVVGTAAAAVPVLAGGGADTGSDGSALIAATETDPGNADRPRDADDPGTRPRRRHNAPTPPTDEERAQRKAELDAAKQTYDKAFADALGVTVEQVQAAQEKARGAVLLTQLDDLVGRPPHAGGGRRAEDGRRQRHARRDAEGAGPHAPRSRA